MGCRTTTTQRKSEAPYVTNSMGSFDPQLCHQQTPPIGDGVVIKTAQHAPTVNDIQHVVHVA